MCYNNVNEINLPSFSNNYWFFLFRMPRLPIVAEIRHLVTLFPECHAHVAIDCASHPYLNITKKSRKFASIQINHIRNLFISFGKYLRDVSLI